MTVRRIVDHQWTSELLGELPITGDFRLRGTDMTRLETFADAAFAFALTLLVISIDAVPRTYEELIVAFKGVPAFALSFAQIMMFWAGHRAWSRRFGLEDTGAIVLSLMLVFVALVFVYPLKTLFAGLMHWLSDGYLNAGYAPTSFGDVRGVFVVYGAGFCALAGIIALLYAYALGRRGKLLLNSLEALSTRWEVFAWSILSGTGLLSLFLAVVLPDAMLPLAGFVYAHLALTMPILGYVAGRRTGQLKRSLAKP